jgi:hypothetical protein
MEEWTVVKAKDNSKQNSKGHHEFADDDQVQEF